MILGPGMTHRTKAAILFVFFLICGLGFVVTQKVRERMPPPAPHDLFAIVNQQLSAFRASDFQGAYRHAAAGVQQRFTLPQFERMVRERYPEMVRRYKVEFGSVKVQGASAVVQVFFLAPDGSARSFLYSLTYEDDAWKIDGAEELQEARPAKYLGGTRA